MSRENFGGWTYDAPGEIDLSEFAYDAPFEVDGETEVEPEVEEEAPVAYDDAGYDPYDPYGYYDEGAEAEEDDDDDLLAALNETLDEIEAEDRQAFVRELASPTNDALELVPSADRYYELVTRHFIAMPAVKAAPGLSQLTMKHEIANRELGELLIANLRSARDSMEQRRSKVWAS